MITTQLQLSHFGIRRQVEQSEEGLPGSDSLRLLLRLIADILTRSSADILKCVRLSSRKARSVQQSAGKVVDC